MDSIGRPLPLSNLLPSEGSWAWIICNFTLLFETGIKQWCYVVPGILRHTRKCCSRCLDYHWLLYHVIWLRSATLLKLRSLCGEGIDYGTSSNLYIQVLHNLKNIQFWKAVYEVWEVFSGIWWNTSEMCKQQSYHGEDSLIWLHSSVDGPHLTRSNKQWKDGWLLGYNSNETPERHIVVQKSTFEGSQHSL